jgi:hypothetical protein
MHRRVMAAGLLRQICDPPQQIVLPRPEGVDFVTVLGGPELLEPVDLALDGPAFPFATRPLQRADTVLRYVHRRLTRGRDGRDEPGLPHA